MNKIQNNGEILKQNKFRFNKRCQFNRLMKNLKNIWRVFNKYWRNFPNFIQYI